MLRHVHKGYCQIAGRVQDGKAERAHQDDVAGSEVAGQPLAQGNAIVKVEVKLTDTKGLQASHVFTADSHENSGWTPADYAIVPVAPVGDDGVLQPAGS